MAVVLGFLVQALRFLGLGKGGAPKKSQRPFNPWAHGSAAIAEKEGFKASVSASPTPLKSSLDEDVDDFEACRKQGIAAVTWPA